MRWIAVFFLVAGACRGDVQLGPQAPFHAAPLADAGTGSAFLVGTTITLDGTGSYAPDGQITSYRWGLKSGPTTTVTIADPSSAITTFVLDHLGTYVFELTVTDDQGASAQSTVTFISQPPRMTVDAGAAQTVAWRTQVNLSGSYQVEGNFPVTLLQWTFVTKPATSTALLFNENTLTPTFVADAEGTYVVQLQVTTPFASATSTVTVISNATRRILPYTIVDAEYSTGLDRFIFVTDSPPDLHIYDPGTGSDTVVNLPNTPTSVSLEPGGLRAAVGHNLSISVIDLRTHGRIAHPLMPIDVYDLAFGADGRILCFQKAPTGMTRDTYTFDLATHVVTDNTNAQSFFDPHPRLHPSGQSVYATQTGVPFMAMKYDVASASVSVIDSRDIDPGNDLWFIHSGALIVGGDGQIFYSTTDTSTDLTYDTSLPSVPGEIVWTQESPTTSQLLTGMTIEHTSLGDTDAQINLYDDQSFSLTESILLPDTPYNGMTLKNSMKLVAFSPDHSKIYALVNAPPISAIYPVVP